MIQSTRVPLLATAIALASVVAVPPVTASTSAPPTAAVVAGPDFDADGFGDLVLGAPGDERTGTARVLYGTATGLTAARGLRISPVDDGMLGDRSADPFGAGIAWADFDADGFDDVAISAHENSLGHDLGAGSVHVLYGSEAGLGIERNQFWSLLGDDLQGNPRFYDRFGYRLASGDFNGDGHGDLSVLIQQDLGQSNLNIRVIYGSTDGLTPDGAQKLGLVDEQPIFGVTLAAGDVDGDGMDELVAALSDDELDAGAITIYAGSPDGLPRMSTRRVTQDSRGMKGQSQPGDRFGADVVLEDIDVDGFDDLIVGIGHESASSGGAERCDPGHPRIAARDHGRR